MSTSLVYRSALFYESAMLLLYGRRYFSRSQAVAELIPNSASVLDLCCGPGLLYRRFLRGRVAEYVGLDINEKFVAGLTRTGANARLWDLQSERELPRADYVIMQASLYHFLPDPSAIINRMLIAARVRAIIAEPIRNLSTGRVPVLSAFSRRHTDPGIGKQPQRFTEETLDAVFAPYASRVARSFFIPGGREKVYLLNA